MLTPLNGFSSSLFFQPPLPLSPLSLLSLSLSSLSLLSLPSSIKSRVSPEVVSAAKRYAKELESGRTIMRGVVAYPASARDSTSDVLSIAQRDEFMKLNLRPAPVPVGSVIDAMPMMHPAMLVTADQFIVVDAVPVVEVRAAGGGGGGVGGGAAGGSGAGGSGAGGSGAGGSGAGSGAGSGGGAGGGGGGATPSAPPLWEPSVWVPPPGSAVWVHADKSPDPTYTMTPMSETKVAELDGGSTGAAKTMKTGASSHPTGKQSRERRLSSRQLMQQEQQEEQQQEEQQQEEQQQEEQQADKAVTEVVAVGEEKN